MSDNVTTRRLHRFDNGIWTIYNYCEDIQVQPVQVICTNGSWNATVNCPIEGKTKHNMIMSKTNTLMFDRKCKCSKFNFTTFC